MILLDTSLLARLPDTKSPDRPAALAAVSKALRQNEILAILPQNLYEFWAVATRKPGAASAGGQNGLGMTAERAQLWMNRFCGMCQCLPETPDLLPIWRGLIDAHKVTGFKAHDLRLVAGMHLHGISHVLTFNTKHFQGFGVGVLDPNSF